jgi:hypothetical protein
MADTCCCTTKSEATGMAAMLQCDPLLSASFLIRCSWRLGVA